MDGPPGDGGPATADGPQSGGRPGDADPGLGRHPSGPPVAESDPLEDAGPATADDPQMDGPPGDGGPATADGPQMDGPPGDAGPATADGPRSADPPGDARPAPADDLRPAGRLSLGADRPAHGRPGAGPAVRRDHLRRAGRPAATAVRHPTSRSCARPGEGPRRGRPPTGERGQIRRLPAHPTRDGLGASPSPGRHANRESRLLRRNRVVDLS